MPSLDASRIAHFAVRPVLFFNESEKSHDLDIFAAGLRILVGTRDT